MTDKVHGSSHDGGAGQGGAASAQSAGGQPGFGAGGQPAQGFGQGGAAQGSGMQGAGLQGADAGNAGMYAGSFGQQQGAAPMYGAYGAYGNYGGGANGQQAQAQGQGGYGAPMMPAGMEAQGMQPGSMGAGGQAPMGAMGSMGAQMPPPAWDMGNAAGMYQAQQQPPAGAYAPQYAVPPQGYYAGAAGAAGGVGHMHGAAAAGAAPSGPPDMSQLMQDISNGNGIASLGRMLNVQDSEFWKGALVGAAAVLLLTNQSVQDMLFKTGAKAKEAVQSGADKLKQTATDAADQIKP
jgi:hypothetical protein